MTRVPTVNCDNCGGVLGEIIDPETIRIGRVYMRGTPARGIPLKCECGHRFRWHGRAEDVHHVVEGKPGGQHE